MGHFRALAPVVGEQLPTWVGNKRPAATGRSEGYLQYQVDGPWKLVLTVNEFVACHAHRPAPRAQWGYLNSLRDQAVEVVAALPGDDLWPTVMLDAPEPARRTHRRAPRQDTSATARCCLLDVKAALEGRCRSRHAAAPRSKVLDDDAARRTRALARDGA